MINHLPSISAPRLALEPHKMWFVCFLSKALFIKIKSLQEFYKSYVIPTKILICITEFLETLRKWPHTMKLKQFMNSVGNMQICRAVHPLTPSPTSPALLPDSSVSGTPVIPTTRRISPWPRPDSKDLPCSRPILFLPHSNICLPLSSLFLSLFCLSRQLVTHTSTCQTLPDNRAEMKWDCFAGTC